MIRRVFVEKKPGFEQEADALLRDLKENLGLPGLESLRVLIRYDAEGVPTEAWESVKATVFSEPQVDLIHEGDFPRDPADTVFAIEFLPGQFDQRADSAAQCIQIIAHTKPVVATAEVIVLKGRISAAELQRIKDYRINAVDSREASLELPATLAPVVHEPAAVATLDGFIALAAAELAALHRDLGLAMSAADLAFVQDHFRSVERRDPTITEIRILDTYWSDHCRHTTFLSEIDSVEFAEGELMPPLRAAWQSYLDARATVFGEGVSKRPVCLMDLALMGMRLLRHEGRLANLEQSEEVNAASIVVPVEIDGRSEEWLVMFKNETHNHPTEIEPFGGAATCLGGAIRDPLSGRSYVYQAMRVTGAADPRTALADTLPGKLPQRRITTEAARGYSSYGNQIGLATGIVHEIYHPGYVAKRMEIGAVVGAAPRANVVRGTPAPGDVILLVGGATGRDGIGGATGSSKEHTDTALENSAEVQKGDAPTERKLQRLFRHPEVSRMIKRCNDFGAGGVSVAIGELAPGLRIDLDRVPRKYEGLDGTELAISESQERMAVVLDPADVERFKAFATAENLEASHVADVTAEARLRMSWRGTSIVDLSREFLDSNGVRQHVKVRVTAPDPAAAALYQLPSAVAAESTASLADAWTTMLGDLNCCSQKGLVERFDSTIGAATINHPFGGIHRLTPVEAMSAKLPVLEGECDTATLMSFGFNPDIASWSPFHGAVYAVVESVARIVASGGRLEDIRLSFQEYFEKLRGEPERWGKPLAALLGAWTAQRGLGLAAIGGKDSMSGSFNDLDVPPTLVSFALAPVKARHVISPEFKETGSRVVKVSIPRDDHGLPDFEVLRARYAAITRLIEERKVLAAHSVRRGGLAEAVTRMAFGNGIGLRFEGEPDLAALFAMDYGAIVLELAPNTRLDDLPHERIGETIAEPVIECGSERLALDALRAAWESPLESVFPTRARPPEGRPIETLFEPRTPARAKLRVAKPRVFIPVFPGTNCEYDSARVFREAGALPREFVFLNRTDAQVDASLAAMAAAIDESQILFLPGGFSAGDEPAGSGKFIAAVFRNPAVRDATMRLLRERDGLILGICNGFQALVKIGLLPYGEIREMTADCPTLTYNTIGRHVSCYVRTKVVSKLSPWLSRCSLGEEYIVPVSHGEGRFFARESVARELFAKDQVATQYVGADGKPTYDILDNPNGSIHAIEGITSPCGRVFGKMAHSERVGTHVGRNIPGEKVQPIFDGGVAYFA